MLVLVLVILSLLMFTIVRRHIIFKMYRNRVRRRRKYTQLRSRVIGSGGNSFSGSTRRDFRPVEPTVYDVPDIGDYAV